MVTIIMVVAVLLIHMDRPAVASMKPRVMRWGVVPTRLMACRAMRRCSPHFSMVTAMRKPPRNR